MRLERIISIKGGRAQTQNGFFPIIGNASMAVGQIIPGFDGHVIGRINPAVRRPVWETTPEAQNDIPVAKPLYYHFADASALKMYYVDLEFGEIVKTENIAAPVDGATLVLHCYDADNEYLVWMVPTWDDLSIRCIINKDDDIVADFISVFTSTPDYINAYIDGSGSLIWSAANTYGGLYIATYANGALLDSRTLDSAGIDALMTEYASMMLDKLRAVSFSASPVSQTRVVRSRAIISFFKRNMVVYEARYGGVFISSETWGISSSANVSVSNAYPILFNSDAVVPVSSSGDIFLQVHIVAEGTSNMASTSTVDQSYDAGGLSAQLSNTVLVRLSDGQRVAEVQKQGGDVTYTVPSNTYAETVTEEYNDEPEEFPTTVVALTKNGYSTTVNGCWVVFSEDTDNFSYGEGAQVLHDIIDYQFNMYSIINGEKISNTGCLKSSAYNASSPYRNYYYILASNPWPSIPTSIVVEAYRGTETDDNTTCDVEITASFQSINQPSTSVSRSIGGGYAIRDNPTLAGIYGAVVTTHALTKGGAVIFDGGENIILGGPWAAGNDELAGITTERDHKLIVAKGNNVTVSDFSLFGSTVTKRFVAKEDE